MQKRQERMSERMAAHIHDPRNEKNVHGIRTSLRKLDAAFSIAPKRFRRTNSEFIQTCRKFFRANSRIRDYDMIQARLANAGRDETIQKSIKGQRDSELKLALDLAYQIEDLPMPKGMDFSKSALERRAEKVILRLCKKFGDLIPIVLSDESKIDDLHKLRKVCKKLRYLLEILPENGRKQPTSNLEKTIKKSGIKFK